MFYNRLLGSEEVEVFINELVLFLFKVKKIEKDRFFFFILEKSNYKWIDIFVWKVKFYYILKDNIRYLYDLGLGMIFLKILNLFIIK